MHKPNQWSLSLRATAARLMNSSSEGWLCMCVRVLWLVLMSLMNRHGAWSLWTPAAAITPKEQPNHFGFPIWAGYLLSLKLKYPSLPKAHDCSVIVYQ